MIRTTPFHARTSELNETGLWSHWSGHLAAERYGLSDKFEYFAVRNAAGIFDTSPLFKYRFSGPGAEAFLAGVLARDPRTLEPGHGAVRDLVRRPRLRRRGRRAAAAREGRVRPHRRRAEPRLLPGPRDAAATRSRSRRSREDWAVLSLQGPRARRILAGPRARRSRRCRTSASPAARSAAVRSRSRAPATPATSATRSGSRPRTRCRRGTRSGRRRAGSACCRSGSRRCT